MRKLKNNELDRINIKEFKSINKTPITIVLDNIRSALNVGAIFRTSDAFLIEKVILCGITSTPPNNEIRKTALDSTLSVNWEYHSNILDVIENLKQSNTYIFGIEQTEKSTMLNDVKLPKVPIAIILGNEINGVNQDALNKCDEIIEIPQFGTKHSLNISVAMGIIVWELWKKLSFKS